MARVEGMIVYSQVCVCRQCGFTGTEHNDFDCEEVGDGYCIQVFVPERNEVVEAWGVDEVASCPSCGGFNVDEICDVGSERGKRLLAQFRDRNH